MEINNDKSGQHLQHSASYQLPVTVDWDQERLETKPIGFHGTEAGVFKWIPVDPYGIKVHQYPEDWAQRVTFPCSGHPVFGPAQLQLSSRFADSSQERSGFREWRVNPQWTTFGCRAPSGELIVAGAWLRKDESAPWDKSPTRALSRAGTILTRSQKLVLAEQNAKGSRLLQLPAELRLEIWEEVLAMSNHYTHFELTHRGGLPSSPLTWNTLPIAVQRSTMQDINGKVRVDYRPRCENPSAFRLRPGYQFELVPLKKHREGGGHWKPLVPLLMVCTQTFNEAAPIARKNPHTYSFQYEQTLDEWLSHPVRKSLMSRQDRALVKRLYIPFTISPRALWLLCGLQEVLLPRWAFFPPRNRNQATHITPDWKREEQWRRLVTFWRAQNVKVTILD